MIKKCINNNLEDGNSSKLQWRHLALGGNKKIQRPMHAQLKKAKAMVSTKVKKPKVTFMHLLEKYQKISELKGAYRPSETKASKSPLRHKFEDRDWRRKKLSKQTLLLGHQCRCHGYLPMLSIIQIHGTSINQGHTVHHILNHITKIMQLPEDDHLFSNHM